MVSERIYDLCRPILEDEELGEEEKTDKLEQLLSSPPSSLKGKALEDAVLGALWQWKTASESKAASPPSRYTTTSRTRSPAPWIQRAATPTSSHGSPRPSSSATPSVPPGFGPYALARTKSATISPFGSPKPSPRLPLATPVIPHSPRLSVYQFSDSSPTTENYGDYGSDTVDWLVNDDASSSTSLGDAGFGTSSDAMQPYTTEMSTYDMLRSILQDGRSDEELGQILEANGWDLSQTINSLMEAQGMDSTSAAGSAQQSDQPRTFLIGKNMSPGSRPVTPAGQAKSATVCRYWLASGHCARADCRFAHEIGTHVCKYWLAGNCLAGQNCLFSHDPALLMQNLALDSDPSATPQYTPNFQLSDYDSFPALQPTTSNPYENSDSPDPATLTAVLQQQQQQLNLMQAVPGLFPAFVPTGPRLSSRPNSRPTSRHNSRAPTPGTQPNFHDDEAFPTLGSAASKPAGKRHHGKRGGHGHHVHSQTVQQPSSLADVVRMSPSPGPNATPTSSRDAMRRGLHNNRSFTSSRENSSAAMAIPAPKDIPWLETGDKVNLAYMKARQEAFKHGGLRNKFLQSAAQAWNRNDARGAKALSLRGQNENALMREKHREAARALYEERNKALATSSTSTSSSKELYVDLHGLHPEEAVQYLSDCLADQRTATAASIPRHVYAICGTGHHSKNGKDKVGKAVRAFLNDARYAFREFSVPGDRNNVGGILGIDPSSFDREAAKKALAALAAGGSGAVGAGTGVVGAGVTSSDSGVGLEEAGQREDTKVMLVKDDPRKTVGATRVGR